MTDPARETSSWFYEGVWGMLSSLLCVPRVAPELPAMGREEIVSRKPSPGFMRYLKLRFWVCLCFGLFVLLVVSIVIVILAVNESTWFLVALLPIAIAFVVLGAVAYLAIYLRFDTTWYVFSDRSMRLRRGIWLIRESTITYENIQNVKVTQGPLERYFGIANVVVETAGGGGASSEPGGGLTMHAGLIEGVAEAAEIRDSIMSRVRTTNTTGLGDEFSEHIASTWSPKHLEVLKEIRDLSRQIAARDRR